VNLRQQKNNNINGIILAGGKSSRMGTDKALLKIGNKTLLEILFEKLNPFCRTVLISTNNPEIKIEGAKIIKDKIKNTGPAGGIYSALSASESEKNIIVSVDTPFVTKELFDFLLKNNTSKTEVLIISEKNKLHPLIGIYSKQVSEIFSEEIKIGNYKIRDIIKKTRHKILDISEKTFYNENLLKNINTPEDYNSALKHAGAEKE